MASKRKTLSKKKFLEWSNNYDFAFKVDNNNNLTLLKCKFALYISPKSGEKQEKQNVCGHVLDGILNYTEGVQYIHKANFDNHCKAGSLHNWARKTFEKDQSQPTSSQETTPITLETNQKTIFSIVGNTAKDNYTRLIRTALHVAIKEKPFLDPGVLCSKPLGSFKVDSAFHPSKVNKMSTRNFWELNGKK